MSNTNPQSLFAERHGRASAFGCRAYSSDWRCLVEFGSVVVEARNNFDDAAMFEPSTHPILAVSIEGRPVEKGCVSDEANHALRSVLVGNRTPTRLSGSQSSARTSGMLASHFASTAGAFFSADTQPIRAPEPIGIFKVGLVTLEETGPCVPWAC
jgi:hypothetical protein